MMVTFLTTAAAFIVALGILIAVHEFGHFWFARLLGVKVLTFSIGFGKPIWSVRRGPDQTQYAVGAIPLGGYVKMLDEREGEVDPSELSRAFNRQPVAKRFAIVMAGPLFNLVFALIAMWVMLVMGVPDLKSIIGGVDPGSPAELAGLQPQMTIVAVDGRETPTWGGVRERLLPKVLNKEPVDVTVMEKGATRTVRLPLDRIQGEANADKLLEQAGLQPYQPPLPAVIGEVVPGSAAEKAGLVRGDRIVAIDDRPVGDWNEMARAIAPNPEKWIRVTVERGSERLNIDVRPDRNGEVGRIGVGPAEMEMPAEFVADVRYEPLHAMIISAERNWEAAVLTLRMLGRMVVGEASLKNISGPITIARYAKITAELGVAQFFGFLALVSLSLGVLNLLPIPVLDGGHLMFYVVEAVKGSPVSQQTELVAQKVGIIILLMLMAIAFYNDLAWLGA